MKVLQLLLSVAVLLVAFTSVGADRCTSIIVGRAATEEGITMNTHTNDCFDCDFRIARIPAKKHGKNATRAIPPMRFTYPRYVGDRSPHYLEQEVEKVNNWGPTVPIGYIPEVEETYALVEGSYAISNEHGVALGESTCGSKLVSAPIYAGGKALLEITELGRIALERSRTAREAIRVMGELAVKYGYFSSEWEGEGTEVEGGESYTVTDAYEAWVMHMSPDDTGASAVWVAQRVPDNHVAVVTNTFIIREVPLPAHADANVWMMSDNLHTVAQRLGFWVPDAGPLDFKRAYGYAMPPVKEPYVSRRQWRVLSRVAPSLRLPSTLTSFELPFSVQPDRLVTLADVKALHRDHFEGTPYDTTVGLAAGPFGNPNRYDMYSGATGSAAAAIATAAKTVAKNTGVRTLRGDKYNPYLPVADGVVPEELLRAAGRDEEVQCRFDSGFAVFAGKSLESCISESIPTQRSQLARALSPDRSDALVSMAAPLSLGEGADPHNVDRAGGDPLSDDELLHGHQERTISLFRTAYSVISTARVALGSVTEGAEYLVTPPSNSTLLRRKSGKTQPLPRQVAFVVYLSLHQPKSSVYTPLFPALPHHLPVAYRRGSLYQATPDSAWWAFAMVSNYCERAWRYMIRDVEHVQRAWEQTWDDKVREMQRTAADAVAQMTADGTVSRDDAVYVLESQVAAVLRSVDVLPVSGNLAGGKNGMDSGKSAVRDNMVLVRQLSASLTRSLNVDDDADAATGTEIATRNAGVGPAAKSATEAVALLIDTTAGTVVLPQVKTHTPVRTVATTTTVPSTPAIASTSAGSAADLATSAAAAVSHAASTAVEVSLSTPVARVLQVLLADTVALERMHEEQLQDWWRLFWRLLSRYHDGYRFDTPQHAEFTATPLFYPTWWLRAVRFWRQFQDDVAVTGRDYVNASVAGVGEPVRGVRTDAARYYAPVVNGSEYSSGYSAQRGYVNAGDLSPSDAAALFARGGTAKSVERDALYYPGDQCDAPATYNGTGAYAYVEDSYEEAVRRTNGAAKVSKVVEPASASAWDGRWMWVWWALAGVCVFAVGYIVGHSKAMNSHAHAHEYNSIPLREE